MKPWENKKSPYVREDYEFNDVFSAEQVETLLNDKYQDFASEYLKTHGDYFDTCLYNILSPFDEDIRTAIGGTVETGEYYVYFAFCNSDVVYIGSGKGDRYKHVNSGVSSSWYLNKLYFDNETILCVRVVKGLSKDFSLIVEQLLIEAIKPLGNKAVGNKGVERRFLRGKYDSLIDALGAELEIVCFDYSNDPVNGMPKPRKF